MERTLSMRVSRKRNAPQRPKRAKNSELYRLVEIVEEATIACLMKDLAVHERLDAMIEKCLKRFVNKRRQVVIAERLRAVSDAYGREHEPVFRPKQRAGVWLVAGNIDR